MEWLGPRSVGRSVLGSNPGVDIFPFLSLFFPLPPSLPKIYYYIPFGSCNMRKYIDPPCGRANTATLELNISPYCTPMQSCNNISLCIIGTQKNISLSSALSAKPKFKSRKMLGNMPHPAQLPSSLTYFRLSKYKMTPHSKKI